MDAPAPATTSMKDALTAAFGEEPQILPEDMPPEEPPPHRDTSFAAALEAETGIRPAAVPEGEDSIADELEAMYGVRPEVPETTPATPAPSEPPAQPAPSGGFLSTPVSPLNDALTSAALGATKGVLEAKDFAVEMLWPKNADTFNTKSAARKWMEEQAKELRNGSVINGVAQSIAQFGVGFIGLGKVKWVKEGLQAARSMGKAATVGAEAARGAAAATVVMDPHEERFANLVENYPALSNPVSVAQSAEDKLEEELRRLHGDIDEEGLVAGAKGGRRAHQGGQGGRGRPAGAPLGKTL